MSKQRRTLNNRLKKRFDVTELRRSFPTRNIPKDQLDQALKKDEDKYKHDPVFHSLYIDLLLGKRDAALTRMSLSRIQSGFLDENATKSPKLVEDHVDKEVVNSLSLYIRGGLRHALFLYKSRISSEFDFFCSDDSNAFYAYKQLGMAKVPVVLLDYDVSDLEDSAICISYPNYKDQHFVITGTLSTPEENRRIVSFFIKDKRQNIANLASKLESITSETLEHLSTFHLEAGVQIHYHHTLASILFRIKQSLHAIRLLAEDNLLDQIIIQIRAIYELLLNFYIDWLAPEDIGPYTQLFSITTRKAWGEMRKEYYNEKRKEEWSNAQIKALMQGDNRLYDLLTKVSEKAKINPLGPRHHDLYGFLSRFAHQDFFVTARHAHILNNPQELKDDPEFLKYLKVYLDIIVAQIIHCIKDDLGNIE